MDEISTQPDSGSDRGRRRGGRLARGACGLCLPVVLGGPWLGLAVLLIAGAAAILLLVLGMITLGAAFARRSVTRRACIRVLQQVMATLVRSQRH